MPSCNDCSSNCDCEKIVYRDVPGRLQDVSLGGVFELVKNLEAQLEAKKRENRVLRERLAAIPTRAEVKEEILALLNASDTSPRDTP